MGIIYEDADADADEDADPTLFLQYSFDLLPLLVMQEVDGVWCQSYLYWLKTERMSKAKDNQWRWHGRSECRFESKIESKIESKVESKIESEFESKFENEFEVILVWK